MVEYLKDALSIFIYYNLMVTYYLLDDNITQKNEKVP